MNILITGSQGFIGSYLCSELLANGYKVTGIDNYSKYGYVRRAHDNHPNFYLIKGDVLDILPKNQFSDIDYIVNLAAMIGGIAYFHKYAYDLLATNERIQATVFDRAIYNFKYNNLKRIINVSSSMVFESTSRYPTPESEVTSCPPPLSTYGFQKLASEYFCKGAWEQYRLPYTIIRPFNCVGVGEEVELSKDASKIEKENANKIQLSHVLPDFVHRALHIGPNDEFAIYGTGKQVRHYTNGKDLARGIRLALESEKAINEDFNLSHPRPISVLELAEMVWSRIHSTPLKPVYMPAFEYDVQYRSPDVTKAKEILGFEAKVSVEESIDEVINWVKNHE